MLQYHKKVEKLLKDQQHRDPCPVHPSREHQQEPIDTPVSGQFDTDGSLDMDLYDPLKTPTDMPIQDETVMPVQKDFSEGSAHSKVVTAEEDRMLDEEDNNVSVVSSSQEK